ncbi:MAG: hypothetical protein ACXWWX_01850 [Actinomycetota bacterium]
MALVAAVVVLAGSASAGEVWDPDDVTGPLDIRSLGARFVLDDDTTRVTISFYDGFRISALPALRRGHFYPGQRGKGRLGVGLTNSYAGYFMRREDGRPIFVYGDWGSDCCWIVQAKHPSRGVLRVTFPTIREAVDLSYEVWGWSRWKKAHEDQTATIELGVPPEQ